ncbi:LysM peptidoglycan-binding domain-containing protein [Streptomyces lonarensis]|uniref:LysM peptidoglycan-binding domain-containing protein n=2 Tax=Streptomyces lonarensis TaxID=700599 RepID=A0A7X6CXB3_9ACTN|nr:LysM peptidoglycan-binding domain-containing protein [Streptomyces lonarensis]
MRGHRDGIATECPGGELYAWVRAGMPRPGGGAATHTVEPDQTMWSISQQHGVDLDALRAANPKVREDRIFPDDVLTIPKAGAPAPKPPAPKPTPPARPVVSLARLVQAARVDPPKRGTPVSYSPTRVVEDALAKEGLLTRSLVDGHFGTATVSAYAAWQRRLGYRGRDADGIPGRASLNALAKKYGFTTTN